MGAVHGFVFNPDEPNVHLSWIDQARQGQSSSTTLSPPTHVGRFFNLFIL